MGRRPKSKLLEMAYAMDEELYKCNALIVKNSVYFSVASTELFLKFAGNIFGDAQDQTNEGLEIVFDEYYTNQLRLANEAVGKVREELGLAKLNRGLFGRVR